MQYVSATDAKQTFAAVLDTAQREPVVIRKQNRDVAVMISMRDYERLRRINIEEFQRYCDLLGQESAAKGLTEKVLNNLLSSTD